MNIILFCGGSLLIFLPDFPHVPAVFRELSAVRKSGLRQNRFAEKVYIPLPLQSHGKRSGHPGPLSQIHHAGSGILFLLSTDETQPRLCGHRSGSGGILHRILPARIIQYNDKQKNGGGQFCTNTAGRFPTTRQGRNMVYPVLPDASRARMDLPWKRERSLTPESESRWLLPVSIE